VQSPRPYQSFISTVCRGVRVIHQRFQSRQSLTFRGRPICLERRSGAGRVEHLNVSGDALACSSGTVPTTVQCSKATIGNHNHRSPRQPSPLALSFVWPNPSAACVDDFAVRGSVVKGLRRLETVMPRPAVGIGTRSIRLNHRRPLASSGYHWSELGHDRSLAAIRFPRRRSIIYPITSTPVGANTTIK